MLDFLWDVFSFSFVFIAALMFVYCAIRIGTRAFYRTIDERSQTWLEENQNEKE